MDRGGRLMGYLVSIILDFRRPVHVQSSGLDYGVLRRGLDSAVDCVGGFDFPSNAARPLIC